jgi:hypothetical protein
MAPQDPLRDEHLERLAERRPAQSQFRPKSPLGGQPVAGGEAALHDEGPELSDGGGVGDLVQFRVRALLLEVHSQLFGQGVASTVHGGNLALRRNPDQCRLIRSRAICHDRPDRREEYPNMTKTVIPAPEVVSAPIAGREDGFR